MNLILCGMMGSGKSTVGAKLAQRIGWKFCDTDQIITEKHGDIPSIFQACGEAHFRVLETEIVTELALQDGLIISTGGGLVLQRNNVEQLKQKGKFVFLRASVETLSNRLKGDGSRPLLQSATESVTERLTALLKDRTPIYERVADVVVGVDNKTPDEIADEIIKIMKLDQRKGAGAR